LEGHDREVGNPFEGDGDFRGGGGRFAPGKRSVAVHERAAQPQRVAALKALHDALADGPLVGGARDFLLIELSGERNGVGKIVCVGGAKTGILRTAWVKAVAHEL